MPGTALERAVSQLPVGKVPRAVGQRASCPWQPGALGVWNRAIPVGLIALETPSCSLPPPNPLYCTKYFAQTNREINHPETRE